MFYLGTSAHFTKWEKAWLLSCSGGNQKDKKKTYVARYCVLHKVAFSLGSQDILLCPFRRFGRCIGLPENNWYYSHSIVAGGLEVIS